MKVQRQLDGHVLIALVAANPVKKLPTSEAELEQASGTQSAELAVIFITALPKSSLVPRQSFFTNRWKEI
jgi:hypothetical protein